MRFSFLLRYSKAKQKYFSFKKRSVDRYQKMFAGVSQSSLLQRCIPICDLLLFVFWKLEKNWIFCTQCQGRGVPLLLLWLDPLEQMIQKVLQGCSQRLLWLCAAMEMFSWTHISTNFCGFCFFCSSVTQFLLLLRTLFVDMQFSEMLRKFYWRVFVVILIWLT